MSQRNDARMEAGSKVLFPTQVPRAPGSSRVAQRSRWEAVFVFLVLVSVVACLPAVHALSGFDIPDAFDQGVATSSMGSAGRSPVVLLLLFTAWLTVSAVARQALGFVRRTQLARVLGTDHAGWGASTETTRTGRETGQDPPRLFASAHTLVPTSRKMPELRFRQRGLSFIHTDIGQYGTERGCETENVQRIATVGFMEKGRCIEAYLRHRTAPARALVVWEER